MTNRTRGHLLVAALLIFASGCRSCHKKRDSGCGPDRIPASGAMIGPPGTLPPAGIQERSSFYAPRNEILLPETRSATPRIEERSSSKPPVSVPIKPEVTASKIPVGDLPLGIPDFAVVKEGTWTGQRPELDGLDWLKAKTTRRVVYLRGTSEDEASDRQQVERRGIAFESIAVEPNTLNADIYRNFAKAVNSPKPVFVYDRTGNLKGYLWYIYLRVNELLPVEVAKLQAERLGYSEDGTPERKELALAAQRVVDQLK